MTSSSAVAALPMRAIWTRVSGSSAARLTVTEGRYHQVRRMFAAVGNHVETLTRVAVGGLTLGELPAGQWRALATEEVAQLFSAPPGP